MAQTAKLVTAAKPPKKTGAVFYAPLGTALPTDATAALDAAYVPLGYVAEEGVTNSNSPSTSTVKAWGGDVVLTTIDELTDQFKFTLIEALNPNVLKAVYGSANVTGTLEEGITVSVGNDEREHCVWLLDMVLKGGAKKRIVITDAELTGLEDITYAANSAVGYGVTLTAYANETDGKTHYEYIKVATTSSTSASTETAASGT